MALDDQKLHDNIKAAFDAAKAHDQPDQQAAALIDGLRDAIATYVKGADVTGVTVTVQNNAGTQTGTGKLS